MSSLLKDKESVKHFWLRLADEVQKAATETFSTNIQCVFHVAEDFDCNMVGVLEHIAGFGVKVSTEVSSNPAMGHVLKLDWDSPRRAAEVSYYLREKFPREPAPQPGKLGQAIHTLAEAHTPQPRRNYVLWTGGWIGNDLLLWRKERRGYTTNLNDAHRFTKEEAERQHKVRESDIPINLDLAAPGFITVINPEVMKGDDRDKLWEDINKYRR